MLEYAHAMYQVWRQGKTDTELEEQRMVFVALVAKTLRYTPKEVSEELVHHKWFIKPD